MDYTAQRIDSLVRFMRDDVVDFVNEARANGLALVVTSGRRSTAEQSRLVQAGRSRTMQSKHLSGQAFDVDLYGIDRNRVPAEIWAWIGPLGESYGFTWGGRWTSFRDWGHFEL